MNNYEGSNRNGSTLNSANTVHVAGHIDQLLSKNPGIQDPLAMVRGNLTPPTAQAQQPVAQQQETPIVQQQFEVPSAQVQQVIEQALPEEPTNGFRDPYPVPQHIPAEVKPVEASTEEETFAHGDESTNPALDFVNDKAKKPTKEESFAALRRKLTEEKESKQALESQVQELSQTLEAYKTGEALPDKIKELQDTITELREFQKLHDLKTTPEYREKYIEPIKQLKEQGAQLARDYKIPEEVFQQAMGYTNQRDLNVFLSEHFDPIGAGQARELIRGIQNLEGQRQQAESQPGEVYEQLLRESEQRQQQVRQEKYNKNKDQSLLSWKDAHTALMEAQQFPELTLTGHDHKHDSYAKPIVDRAKTEFAKFVHYLSDKGVELDSQFLNIMAKRMLLSEATAVMAKSRAEMYKQSQEVIESTKKAARYDRPTVGTNVGGVNGRGGYENERQMLNPRLAADSVLESILK